MSIVFTLELHSRCFSILSLFYRWITWPTERLNNSPKITQLTDTRKVWNRDCVTHQNLNFDSPPSSLFPGQGRWAQWKEVLTLQNRGWAATGATYFSHLFLFKDPAAVGGLKGGGGRDGAIGFLCPLPHTTSPRLTSHLGQLSIMKVRETFHLMGEINQTSLTVC